MHAQTRQSESYLCYVGHNAIDVGGIHLAELH